MKHSSIIIKLLMDMAEDDSAAFSKFYDIFYPTVYKFSRYFTKSEDSCKEVVSDVFYSLWQRRKSLIEIDNLESYIFIVIKNQALKTQGKKLKQQIDPLEMISGDFLIEASTPESMVIDKELERAIANAVNELPARCKLIFLMAREQNLKHKQIAEILSISEHTVHAQLTIASKKIAEFLEGFFK